MPELPAIMVGDKVERLDPRESKSKGAIGVVIGVELDRIQVRWPNNRTTWMQRCYEGRHWGRVQV